MLTEHGDEGRVLAGGHSLIPMMKLRLANPALLIDLGSVAGLKGIEEAGDAFRIGAMTTQAEVIASGPPAVRVPILRETALQIADPQVRYCGTIGGNVANGDPGNDMPAVMLTLAAEFLVRRPSGERSIPRGRRVAGQRHGGFFYALFRVSSGSIRCSYGAPGYMT